MKLRKIIYKWSSSDNNFKVDSHLEEGGWRITSESVELYKFCREYFNSVYGTEYPKFKTDKEAMRITEEMCKIRKNLFPEEEIKCRPFKASSVIWLNQENNIQVWKDKSGEWKAATIYGGLDDKNWLLYYIQLQLKDRYFKTKQEAVKYIESHITKSEKLKNRLLLKIRYLSFKFFSFN